jgi:hypothetical protein
VKSNGCRCESIDSNHPVIRLHRWSSKRYVNQGHWLLDNSGVERWTRRLGRTRLHLILVVRSLMLKSEDASSV